MAPRADLREANLRGAGLRGALLDEADLRDTRLGCAFLVGASLRGADLPGAYTRLAKLDDAAPQPVKRVEIPKPEGGLSDANLEGAGGLTQRQFDWAHCSSGTTLPDGLTRMEHAKK